MGILPVSNVINVSITTTPSGLSLPNVNNLSIFSNESPINPNTYGVFQKYQSPSQVIADWGTDSVTAQMANAIFSQSPNILTGRGQLVILPMIDSVSATEGNIVTTDISGNLAALIAVSDGDLKVTLNSVVHNLANMNFTNCLTLANIAAVLQANLPDAIVTSNSTTITITSKKVGSASTVALAAYSGGGTDLTATGLLHTASATPTAGVNSSGETLLQAIARTSSAVFYAGVMTNLDLEDAVVETTAAAIQALDKIYLQHDSSTDVILGLGTTISQASETKTRILLYTPSQAAANLEKAAYAGRAFSTDFTGSNTAATMNLKSLVTIDPDLGISQTLYDEAETAGVDLYVSYDGVPSVFSTGGNDFFDNVYMDLAIKFALQTAGFNYLRQTNTKVPQTEPGMNGLKSSYSTVMTQYVNNGCVAPGTWDSAETFGDPEIFRANIENYGFYIFSQPVAQQSSVDRDARIAPLVQIAFKRAGAIQSGNVIVLVNN